MQILDPDASVLYSGYNFRIHETRINDFKVVGFAYHESKPHRVVAPHSHHYYELHFITKGAFTYRDRNGTVDLREGDICFNVPGETHEILGNGTDPWFIYCLQIDDIQHPELLQTFENTTTRRLPDSWDMINDFTEIVEEAKKPGYISEDLLMVKIYAVLINICRELKKAEAITGISLNRYSRVIVSATSFIEHNCRHGLSVDEVAREVGVAKSTLSRYFDTELNETISEYNKRLLMCKVKHLLEHTDLSITRIAEELGYPSIHYLSSSFKAYFGHSPKEYRLQHSTNKQ